MYPVDILNSAITVNPTNVVVAGPATVNVTAATSLLFSYRMELSFRHLMPKVMLGLICGLVFGAVDVGLMAADDVPRQGHGPIGRVY